MRVWLIRFVLLATFLAVWEITSGWLFRPFFISSPSAVLITFWKWVESGRLFYHAGITVIEVFTGFALGDLAGMAVGIVLGQSRTLADILDPFIMIFYSLPKIALAPLFVLWFGVGIDMKIILTASVVFFLVFLNTYTGVRNVSRELIAILRLMGASDRHVLTKVILPSAVSWVFAGRRRLCRAARHRPAGPGAQLLRQDPGEARHALAPGPGAAGILHLRNTNQ